MFSICIDPIGFLLYNYASHTCVFLPTMCTDLKQENVESTKAILRLVMNGRPKFLNFVSTINVLYCCKNDGSLDETMFSTAESVGNWYKYGSGYNCTKWVSEQLIIQAIDRGFVNGAISRPGPIGPHSETGEANDGDWLHYLFSAMLELGVYPRSTLQGTPKLFLAPVDYVAKGVAAVSLRGNTAKDLLPGAKYAVYHYWYSHQPLRQDDFAAALLAIKPLKTIDFGEFKLILAEQSKKGSISVSRIGKIISFFPTEESFSLIKHVDKAYFNLSDDHTRSVLKNNYGIAAPPYDEQAISSYSRWMAKTVERSLQSRL
jgi:nucleoside-diphosphate-sugar epimerase